MQYNVLLSSHSRSNSVWVFDFLTDEWFFMQITGNGPLPRYGQTQIVIDDEHLLIVGGYK